MRFSLIIPLLLFACTACAPTARQGSEAAPAAHFSRRSSPDSALPGKQRDGSVLLPNLWSLRPVGTQVELGDFPINIAIHPQGRFAAILHSGYSHHGIM